MPGPDIITTYGEKSLRTQELRKLMRPWKSTCGSWSRGTDYSTSSGW